MTFFFFPSLRFPRLWSIYVEMSVIEIALSKCARFYDGHKIERSGKFFCYVMYSYRFGRQVGGGFFSLSLHSLKGLMWGHYIRVGSTIMMHNT